MSLKSCLRLARNFGTNTAKPLDSFLFSSAFSLSSNPIRHSSTVSPIFAEYHRKRKKEWKKGKSQNEDQTDEQSPTSKDSDSKVKATASNLLYTIPELVPTTYWGHRDSVREALERVDLAKRRATMKIPEFYVGSLLSVTVADNLSPTKQTKFVGICIQKGEPGLRHRFTLRNIIDEQGVEIMYEIYNPMIRDITVLKLERRLDDDMSYLRDALPEYSTVPFDMKPVPRGARDAVPLNETKVKMKKKPWTVKWERRDVKGIDQTTVRSRLGGYEKMARLEPVRNKMIEKFDLAFQYRHSVTREETDAIYEDMVGRFDRSKDMDSLPEEERPIISRRKARKV